MKRMSNVSFYIPFPLRSAALLAWQARTLVENGRFACADALIERGLRRHAGHAALMEQHALSAHNDGRYAAARERWDRLRRHDPDHRMAWTGVACNARELGDNQDAVAVLLEAFARFPGDALLLSEARRLMTKLAPGVGRTRLFEILAFDSGATLEQTQDFVDLLLDRGCLVEAEAAIADARVRFAGAPGPLERAGRLAVTQGEWARAIEIVEEHDRDHPASPVVRQTLDTALHQLAAFASDARYGNPAKALGCFELIVKHDARNPLWTAGFIDCRVRLGRLDEADEALVEAEQRFPADLDIAQVRANLHAKRERWDEAITILQDCLAKRPSDTRVREQLAHFVAERAYHDTPIPEPRFAGPQDVGREEDAAKRELLLQFESIGENCEFGLVQRRFGAEPIGLFRWNSTLVEPLTAALQAKLAGMGTPEFTHMGIWDEVEYYLSDRRWGFGFHTFRSRNEVDYDSLYPKMCKRMVYLREKFLSDVASSEKSFVFKSDGATREQLIALQAALSGDQLARLVCVKQLVRAPEGAGVKPGDVFRIGDRLHLGYITRAGYDFPCWKILFDDWIAICRGLPAAGDAPFPLGSI